MSDESKPPPLDLPPSLRPNTRLEMDGLTFLAALPEACFPVAFFDPQFRGLYDKLKYGNEGVSRHRRRAQLDAMDQDTIARFIEGIERALRPTGHLFLWVDKFHLMEGITPVDQEYAAPGRRYDHLGQAQNGLGVSQSKQR